MAYSYPKYPDEAYDYQDKCTCTDCMVNAAKLENIEAWMKEILGILYSDIAIQDTKDSLENALDECAHQVGLKLPNKTLNIERKNETLSAISHVLQRMT